MKWLRLKISRSFVCSVWNCCCEGLCLGFRVSERNVVTSVSLPFLCCQMLFHFIFNSERSSRPYIYQLNARFWKAWKYARLYVSPVEVLISDLEYVNRLCGIYCMFSVFILECERWNEQKACVGLNFTISAAFLAFRVFMCFCLVMLIVFWDCQFSFHGFLTCDLLVPQKGCVWMIIRCGHADGNYSWDVA
jgi:hypothetical protein